MSKKDDLYLEFGDGNILVLTTEDDKVILSRQNGQGVIGAKGPIAIGDNYIPSSNDIVMKFKNVESLEVLEAALSGIKKALS